MVVEPSRGSRGDGSPSSLSGRPSRLGRRTCSAAAILAAPLTSQAIQTDAMAARSRESAPRCAAAATATTTTIARVRWISEATPCSGPRGAAIWTACSFIIVYELFKRIAYY